MRPVGVRQTTKVREDASLDAVSVTRDRLMGLEHVDRDMIASMTAFSIS